MTFTILLDRLSEVPCIKHWRRQNLLDLRSKIQISTPYSRDRKHQVTYHTIPQHQHGTCYSCVTILYVATLHTTKPRCNSLKSKFKFVKQQVTYRTIPQHQHGTCYSCVTIVYVATLHTIKPWTTMIARLLFQMQTGRVSKIALPMWSSQFKKQAA